MPKRDRTLFKPEDPIWNIRYLITKLGGVGPTTEKLMAKGFFPPSPNTVQGWAKRNATSGAWAPALFAIAQDAGVIETPMNVLLKNFRPEHKGPQK
jgi:hypothetical protein